MDPRSENTTLTPRQTACVLTIFSLACISFTVFGGYSGWSLATDYDYHRYHKDGNTHSNHDAQLPTKAAALGGTLGVIFFISCFLLIRCYLNSASEEKKPLLTTSEPSLLSKCFSTIFCRPQKNSLIVNTDNKFEPS